jgi:hypothetical protein
VAASAFAINNRFGKPIEILLRSHRDGSNQSFEHFRFHLLISRIPCEWVAALEAVDPL